MASSHHRLYSIARRILVGLAAVSALAAGAAERPAPSPDAAGLVRQHATGLDEYYLLPGASFGAYRRVLIPPVPVSFTKTWLRDHDKIDAKEAQRLKDEFAELARAELARGLARKGGLAAAEAPGADVLELRASIVDLDIAAPEVRDSAIRREFVYSAGEATLVVELRDSGSGKLLARAVDRREMRWYPELRLANSVTNDAEERDLFQAWARLLRRQLFTARADSKGS